MTTRQRAALRAMANTMDPVLHIGKDGINDNLAKQAWDALEARELIKVTVQKNAPMDAREACAELCERVHARPCRSSAAASSSTGRRGKTRRYALKTCKTHHSNSRLGTGGFFHPIAARRASKSAAPR